MVARHRRLVALVAVGAFVLAACGGDDAPDPAASGTQVPGSEAATTPPSEVASGDDPTAPPGREDDEPAPEDTTDEIPPHAGGPPEGADDPDVFVGEEGSFQASSGPVTDDVTIAEPFTCDGHSRFPPFQFRDVPEAATGIAIVMYDRDVDALHWQVTHIPPDTTKFESDALPDGAVEGENGFGGDGYEAPCPPDGESHEYVFVVFALGSPVDPVAPTSVTEVLDAYGASALEEVELVGRFR